MKTSLFGLVALFFFVSHQVQAAPSQNVRLQLQNIPNSPMMSGKYATISVYADGLVVESFSSPLPMPIPSVTIKQLDARQMEEIEELIEASRNGEITTVTHPFHCLAIATSYDMYTADNGRIFLKRNALCQDPTFNNTSSASHLVDILANLRLDAAKASE